MVVHFMRRLLDRAASPPPAAPSTALVPAPAPALSEATLEPFIDSDPHALQSTLHGSARFGWVQHLWRAGMFDGDLARANVPGLPLTGLWFQAPGADVRLSGLVWWPGQETNRLLVGATRSGKTGKGLALALLNDDGANYFVIDPADGELANLSLVYRGWGIDGDVVWLDPCNLLGGNTFALNPFDALDPTSDDFLRKIGQIVDALVIEEAGKDSIWRNSACAVLTALIAHLCSWPSSFVAGEKATLLDAQEVVTANFPEDVLGEMKANPVGDGLVRREAIAIEQRQRNAPSTWEGVKFSLDTNLAFLNDLGVRRTLRETDWEPAQLRTERLTVYAVLPKSEQVALGRWLRLIYVAVIDRIYRTPAARPLRVVIDEFAALKRFDRVVGDLATMAKFKITYQLAVQDYNQLHELYGVAWQTIVGNCALRQIFGVNDNFTADYVSHALGQTTRNDGFDMVQEHEDGLRQKRWRWVGAPLMAPAEVLGLDKNMMLVMTDTTRPFLLPKQGWWEDDIWVERAEMEIPRDGSSG